MTPPDIKFPLKRDKVVNTREIRPGFWLFELRAGPKAHISRWVVTDSAGRQLGEIKRPRYGVRHLEIYSTAPHWKSPFSLKMTAPALAEDKLLGYLTDYVENFCES